MRWQLVRQIGIQILALKDIQKEKMTDFHKNQLLCRISKNSLQTESSIDG